jgi:hypothetical protein
MRKERCTQDRCRYLLLQHKENMYKYSFVSIFPETNVITLAQLSRILPAVRFCIANLGTLLVPEINFSWC